ncbi:MarR family winged helix-turn-helix transcriptional regulator [Cohnella sp. 56]|uniref:MarR family winged helix-turn-helix transcriptional regulator n=1 Tax=Cohnella sp. 56 TaxID=3113722 RepID=UPI0030E861D3
MNDNQSSLMEQVFRLVVLLRRYQHHAQREHARSGDPHRGQGRVLSLLKMKPEITQRELSYLLDMRNQSLGELLGKLERSGYITRAASEEDRRVMNVKLTEAGAQAAEEMEKRQEDHNKLFDCLSEEEQSNLSAYLNKLIEELDRQLGEDGGDDGMFENMRGGRGPWGPGFGHHGRGRGGHRRDGERGFDPRDGRHRRPPFGGGGGYPQPGHGRYPF